MENKTALQELIEIIQKDIEKIELSNSFKSKREKLLTLKSYKDIICIIDDFNLLQKEKEQMINFAFNFYYDFSNEMEVPFYKITENKDNAEDYYNKTYNE